MQFFIKLATGFAGHKLYLYPCKRFTETGGAKGCFPSRKQSIKAFTPGPVCLFPPAGSAKGFDVAGGELKVRPNFFLATSFGATPFVSPHTRTTGRMLVLLLSPLLHNRNDAGLAGAELALAVEQHTLATGSEDSVGTTGVFEIKPGAVNSVPRDARLGIGEKEGAGATR